jgi:murein DD-endopeptidase
MKLDSTGRFASGNINDITHWYGYSADVLAVCDGTVVSIRENASESSSLSTYIAASPENATGNYISIRISSDQYVFYEHLKPGSIRVKAGQKVKKGQIIAALGFTGQTTGPHLHLHVATENSPLGAEGIPFEFEQYKLLGEYNDFSQFGKKVWTKAKKEGRIKIKDRPAPNSVIDFSP